MLDQAQGVSLFASSNSISNRVLKDYSMSDDAVEQDTWVEDVAPYAYMAMRVILALGVVWVCANMSR